MKPLNALIPPLLAASLVMAEAPTFPDLSRYRGIGVFDYFVAPHTNTAASRHSWSNLLIISTIHDEGRFALEYFTGEKGETYAHRNRFMGIGNTTGTNLNEVQLSRLRSLLRDLPATNAAPPIDRLVLLSFRDGTNWVTRTYDNGDRPKALREIFQVIGERRDEYRKPPAH